MLPMMRSKAVVHPVGKRRDRRRLFPKCFRPGSAAATVRNWFTRLAQGDVTQGQLLQPGEEV